MSTELESRELNAFVDGELDLKRQLEIEARLREDAALRAHVDGMRHVREAVRDGADYHTAPAALRARIARLAAAPTPLQRPVPWGGTVMQRWFAWRPLVSSFGIVASLAIAFNLVEQRAWQDERVSEEVIASHVRATLTQRLVDVASSDRHTVKPWLSSKLDFSPPVRELNIPGSAFLGGRVDYLDGRPVAVLVYRQGNHLVDHYVWPTTDADRRVNVSSRRGFQLARWSSHGMAHRVISDVNAGELAAFVRELELTDQPR